MIGTLKWRRKLHRHFAELYPGDGTVVFVITLQCYSNFYEQEHSKQLFPRTLPKNAYNADIGLILFALGKNYVGQVIA